jgi:Na+/proline symporter
MSVSNPTLITFVIYIAAMVLIGFMAYRSPTTFPITSWAVAASVAW